jgi:hypothetical protein
MRQNPSLLPPLELTLRTEEGEPWVLRLSPGMERFIGCYARIAGFAAFEDRLLRFNPAAD